MPVARYPDPDVLHPITGYDKLVFLKNCITRPNISVGAFTYFDVTGTPDARAEDFETHNVLYHFDFIGDKLLIGSFCALGSGVRFLMNGANHELAPVSTYPFGIFSDGWEAAPPLCQSRGDTVVGNDAWIGFGATIMPGRTIGHGAIVGSGSLVAKDVPPYAIVGGNPARVIRQRFPDAVVERLLAVAWWDWPYAKIARHLPLIAGADVDALERAAGE
ncbi:CatB-related O-acetyltransferase [Solidesulfovibrio alcoholivorans]|uniref:CatB-related O-acetyltransferase n=1 Tax=Solidesulfovibrio alcoholivorans TaxID=81406 RepID=UPI0004981866|nr:CatB-related O-acetyltransferase [Solidesulfovibrio alcoholivorans]